MTKHIDSDVPRRSIQCRAKNKMRPKSAADTPSTDYWRYTLFTQCTDELHRYHYSYLLILYIHDRILVRYYNIHLSRGAFHGRDPDVYAKRGMMEKKKGQR